MLSTPRVSHDKLLVQMTGILARWILGGGDGRCWQRSLGVEIPGTGIREICGRDVFIYGASYAGLLLIRTRILSSAAV